MGFRLTESEAWAMLATAHTGVLTTLRRDGRPVPLPVWHVVADGAIFVQTPAGSKKLVRIAHDRIRPELLQVVRHRLGRIHSRQALHRDRRAAAGAALVQQQHAILLQRALQPAVAPKWSRRGIARAALQKEQPWQRVMLARGRHNLAREDLPPVVAAAYGEMAVVRLDPDGPFLSWNNAALLGR